MDSVAFGAPDGEIHVGDIVKWVNKDVVDHTATEKSKAWRVDVAAGKTGSVVMKTAGTFDYYCEYHPNMTATLVVK
jgi:plastocyanin